MGLFDVSYEELILSRGWSVVNSPVTGTSISSVTGGSAWIVVREACPTVRYAIEEAGAVYISCQALLFAAISHIELGGGCGLKIKDLATRKPEGACPYNDHTIRKLENNTIPMNPARRILHTDYIQTLYDPNSSLTIHGWYSQRRYCAASRFFGWPTTCIQLGDIPATATRRKHSTQC